MKKTLSLMIAAATLIASVPLSFADDSSSSSAASSSSSTVSSSSSSRSRIFTVKDNGPCADKKGLEKVLCVLSVTKGQNASSSSANNRLKKDAKDIVDVCKDKKGLDKANCLHLGLKIVNKVNNNAVGHSNTMGGPCSNLRGNARGLCLQALQKHWSSSSRSSSSSVSSASSL